jgi:O-antigen biosynthesis protein WbqP
MKRTFDLLLAIFLLVILAFPMLLISFAVFISSKGPSIHWSERIGRNNRVFKMPKFRSMILSTPSVASHILDNPESYLSPIGGFLRRSSLDELPQLISIIKGDMSFVGPRPALYNQYELISLRIDKGIDKLLPGITGWSQINGRDEISINEKVNFDVEYLNRQSFWFDLHILWITFLIVIKRDGVSH